MDQKFISGNFLPPPRGYPPIALLNNGHDGHHPAVRTSPLTFSITSLLESRLIEILLPFSWFKVGQLQARGGMGGGRWEGEHLVPSSILPRRLIRGRIDRPALPPHRFTSNTPFSSIPHPPKYSPQFPSPHQHILLSSQKAISPLPHPLDPFLEKLETAPTSKAIGAGVLLKLDPS